MQKNGVIVLLSNLNKPSLNYVATKISSENNPNLNKIVQVENIIKKFETEFELLSKDTRTILENYAIKVFLQMRHVLLGDHSFIVLNESVINNYRFMINIDSVFFWRKILPIVHINQGVMIKFFE